MKTKFEEQDSVKSLEKGSGIFIKKYSAKYGNDVIVFNLFGWLDGLRRKKKDC